MNLKKLFIIVTIFLSSQAYTHAETPYFLNFKLILNESEAGKKAQNFLKKKLDNGIKNLNTKEKEIQQEEKTIIEQKKIISQEDNKKKVKGIYGSASKNEILETLKKIKKKINIKNFEKNLYTRNMPDPEILIRTGGHQRLSNFLLWQLAYAELFFLKKLWPDFNSNDLIRIIDEYKKRKRNFGRI